MSGQYVYFAESCGKIKIGCSVKPPQRLLQIGEWIPHPITLLATMRGTYAVEAAIHRMFDEDFSHGEWFHASPRLRAFVAEVASGRPVVINTAVADGKRRAAIAERKRYSRRLGKCPGWYTSALREEWQSLLGATMIPDGLKAKLDALLAEHGLSLPERPTDTTERAA